MRCSITLREHHVVPTIHGGLDVKRNGPHTAIIHTNTKATAIEQGRILGKVESTGFIILGKVEGFRDLKGMGMIRNRREGESARADNDQRYFQYDND